MKIGVEGTVQKSDMNLVLNDIELFFISFWCYFTKTLGYFCFAKGNYTFILKVATQRHFDESLVSSNSKDSIIVVKLPFEKFISILIIK